MDDRDRRALRRVWRAARALKDELDRCSPAALAVFDEELSLGAVDLLELADELAQVVGDDDDEEE